MTLRPWRGSVLSIRGRLYLQVRDDAGRWRQLALRCDDTPENRQIAAARLVEVRALLRAREDAGVQGPPTVRSWGDRWLRDRRATVRDAGNDEARLRLHVYPVIGHLPLDEVRPRHLVDVVDRLRRDRAPRTVHNVYSVIKALFRDARIADLLQGPDPCILTHRQLGRVRDAKQEWRVSAIFTAEELGALVSDGRVPQDRRVWYALLGIGMLRTGEAAGLRWHRIQRAEPLGRLVVATSYDVGRTKTGEERWMPIHPVLAKILAEWRLGGWPRMFGRLPGDEDLVCPVVEEHGKGRHRAAWSMRDRNWSRRRFLCDLDALGLRRRRSHDLRRTGISLAQDGGADQRILRWATHAPPRMIMDQYTTLAWSTLCKAVAMLTVLTGSGPGRTSTDVPTP